MDVLLPGLPEGAQDGEQSEEGPAPMGYPEPPQRVYQLSELLSFAGYDELAERVRESKLPLFVHRPGLCRSHSMLLC